MSLDAALVEELENGGEALSQQVNDAVREALERRHRARALSRLLAELDARHGRISPALIDKYERLLG